jgi:hypothetical protein
LWQDYERVLDVAADIGLEGISLEVSWARLEPRRGQRDDAALSRYADVIAHARRRGLWVNVAAIDAAWPAWLGLEAWLLPWVVPVAISHGRWLTSSLDVDGFSVFASSDQLTRGFLNVQDGPPWRRGAREDAQSARVNLARIDAGIREGSRSTFPTSVRLDLDAPNVGSFDVDEVHLSSLVRGAGPLASARGLLARRGDEWLAADEDLVGELRRRL